jgi:glycosidase
MPHDAETRLRQLLAFLYGPTDTTPLAEQLLERLRQFERPNGPSKPLSQDDVILITYGDQFCTPNQSPLCTLADILQETLADIVSGVHILPFYPYTSDDGFSVVDYTVVDPQLGDWGDLEALRQHYRLMFDAVINHISASSAWFQNALQGDPEAIARFIVMQPDTDLSQVTRPRTTPLLTPFETPNGTLHIWTTFSADQIDLNFANPAVLLDIIDVLLLYVRHGASLIRLDAIGYIWKEVGTRCIHLPQAHAIVQLFRAVLDIVAPDVLLITETNVPHADNISYFGDGHNEAQLVYQFPLAPLVLNAFQAGNARHLTDWAATLEPPPSNTTFFNFIASHDGLGVVPATGILNEAEVDALVQQVQAHGGLVSFKNNPDGSQSVYELNITLFDALSDPYDLSDSRERKIDRFVAANAIMLALQGVPGVYVHSLVGSPNYTAGVELTGRARSINREKWHRAVFERRINDPHRHEGAVLERMRHLIRTRRKQAAFHPHGPQRVLLTNAAVFALLRSSPDQSEHIVCLHNVSDQPQTVHLSEVNEFANSTFIDLLDENTVQRGLANVELAPYQVRWLKQQG